MVSSPNPARAPQGSRGPSPREVGTVPWVALSQILIGTALLVLFGVMLHRTQEQSQQLRRLEQRLQTLENMRSLERASALEAQLRKLLARLQVVEGGYQQLTDRLEALRALAEQQEQLPRNAAPLVLPAAPLSRERPTSLRAPRPERGAEAPTPGMLRPPAEVTP
ncbi:MAG: hypothetical protein ACK5N0_11930 [Synechococcaceae cyanobacterium]